MLKLQILTDIDYQWVGWCKKKLVALTDMRNRMGVPVLKKSYYLPNNILAQIVSWDLCDIIRITGGGVSGFICHARNNAYPGGIDFNKAPIFPVYAYPLIDNDHGSFVLNSDDATPPNWTSSRDVENYGNLDWIGTDGTVISWRGPGGRLLAMNALNNYPGLTVFDHETLDGTQYFTPYQSEVYQSGDVLYQFPDGTKVIGATDTYVVILALPNVEVWRGTKEKIGSAPVLGISPFVFNQAGTEAVSAEYRLDISDDGKAAAFIPLSSPNGTFSGHIPTPFIDDVQGEWNISENGTWPMYRDYGSKGEKSISLLVSNKESSSLSSTSTNASLSLVVSFPLTTFSISGPTTVFVGAIYSSFGSYCPVTWSFDHGTIDANGKILSVSCGAPGTPAKGTITGHTSNGTASIDVALPGGVWVNVYYDPIPLGCSDYGMPQFWYSTGLFERKRYAIMWTVSFATDLCGQAPCDYRLSDNGVTFDNGVTSGVVYGPGDYAGCGAGITHRTYICYCAHHDATDEWLCP